MGSAPICRWRSVFSRLCHSGCLRLRVALYGLSVLALATVLTLGLCWVFFADNGLFGSLKTDCHIERVTSHNANCPPDQGGSCLYTVEFELTLWNGDEQRTHLQGRATIECPFESVCVSAVARMICVLNSGGSVNLLNPSMVEWAKDGPPPAKAILAPVELLRVLPASPASSSGEASLSAVDAAARASPWSHGRRLLGLALLLVVLQVPLCFLKGLVALVGALAGVNPQCLSRWQCNVTWLPPAPLLPQGASSSSCCATVRRKLAASQEAATVPYRGDGEATGNSVAAAPGWPGARLSLKTKLQGRGGLLTKYVDIEAQSSSDKLS